MTYEEASAAVPDGMYRHFKGNFYKVLSIARHSETLEPMVVYQALYGEGGVWVRPADMWNETIVRDGETFRRFRPVTAEERVSFYELIFDELSAAAEEGKPLPENLRSKYVLLEEYYTSGEWRKDYEADEAGMFPAVLKRGVLSEDGVYDLLEMLGDQDGSLIDPD